MPFANPIGGFLTIVHLFINVAAFTYRKVRKVFKKEPRHSRSALMRWLTDKDSDSAKRRFLAYALAFCVIAGITGFTTSVMFLQSGLGQLAKAPKVADTVASATPNLEQSPKPPEPYIPIAEDQAVFTGTLAIAESSGASASKQYDSIVDLLRFSKIADPSFDERANLAESLNIVGSKVDYSGSAMQNMKMIAIIQEKYDLP